MPNQLSMFRKTLSVLVIILTFSGLSVQKVNATDVIIPEKANFHLYLLVGQSNMAGRGKVEDQDLLENLISGICTLYDSWSLLPEAIISYAPILELEFSSR